MNHNDSLFKTITGTPYDPLTGLGGTGDRIPVLNPEGTEVYIPRSMTLDTEYTRSLNNADSFNRLRTRHDFEYWCATCCHIRDKSTGRTINFTLNPPQRYVATLF